MHIGMSGVSKAYSTKRRILSRFAAKSNKFSKNIGLGNAWNSDFSEYRYFFSVDGYFS